MRRAFTLIEVMIAVSILMILISLAIPNILRSRSVVNERASVANLKILSDSCQLYSVNKSVFPEALSDLIAPTSNPPYIDSVLASGSKQGYQFDYSRNGQGFIIRATPTSILKGRYFYVDETGVMRVNPDAPAGPDDEVLQ